MPPPKEERKKHDWRAAAKEEEEEADMAEPSEEEDDEEKQAAALAASRARRAQIASQFKGGPEKKAEPKAESDEEAKEDVFKLEEKPAEEEENDGNDMFGETATLKVADKRELANAISTTGASAEDWDDSEGYYIPRLNEVIHDRYQIVTESAGAGVFSNVVKCQDKKQGFEVAIKVIRNNDMMRKAAEKEVEILQRLNNADKGNKQHVIRLFETFEYRNHLCLVFECMWDNLRMALKKYGRGNGLHLQAVWSWSKQLFKGLALMKKCKLIHADLKPDNILISNSHNLLKIADLGSAVELEDGVTPTPYLVSRFYRAPEIIFGGKQNCQVDVWAAACTLCECFTGKILFNGKTNNDMLRVMMEIRGKPSTKVIKVGNLFKDHFTPELDFKWMDVDKVTNEPVERIVTDLAVKRPIQDILNAKIPPEKKQDQQYIKKIRQFGDFLIAGLAYDHEKRFEPDEALQHAFVVEPFEKQPPAVAKPSGSKPLDPKREIAKAKRQERR